MQRILRELAAEIGLGDTIGLVRRWGGRDLNVPTKVEAGDPLALTMGLESARRLVRHRGGQRLQLPAERNALLDLRNAAIEEMHAAGNSMEAIGLEFGLTRQGVSHILKNRRELEAVRQKFAGSAVDATA